MARTVLKMPKVSDTDDSVVVLRWLCSVGDTVTVGAPIVEVESSKATVEVPAPVVGTVTEILVAADFEVATGTAICVLDTP